MAADVLWAEMFADDRNDVPGKVSQGDPMAEEDVDLDHLFADDDAVAHAEALGIPPFVLAAHAGHPAVPGDDDRGVDMYSPSSPAEAGEAAVEADGVAIDVASPGGSPSGSSSSSGTSSASSDGDDLVARQSCTRIADRTHLGISIEPRVLIR